MTSTFKNKLIHSVSHKLNSKETNNWYKVRIFYNVLQNLTVTNVHEVSYVVHMTKVHTVVLMIFSVTVAQWNSSREMDKKKVAVQTSIVKM